MVKTIISANPTFEKPTPETGTFLRVAEFFYDTIQGENFVGYPAAFLRLQGCTLGCKWCDSKEVWRFGNPYTIDELFELMENTDIISKLEKGQHLVITGGSPLKQQDAVLEFILAFHKKYYFIPFIEIENECTLQPSYLLSCYVSRWNNSPKLEGSGNPEKARYKPEVIRALAALPDSWFKFVVAGREDFEEINEKFIKPGLIDRHQIVLMPLGATREELNKTREAVVELAVEESVRFSDREHVVIWDKKVGC